MQEDMSLILELYILEDLLIIGKINPLRILKGVFMENSSVDKKNDYNNEPVYFCASCLSLSVMNYTGIVDCYCGHCTSTRIIVGNIYQWEKLYEEKYGHKFLDEKK